MKETNDLYSIFGFTDGVVYHGKYKDLSQVSVTSVELNN